MYKSGVLIVLVTLFLVVPMASFSADDKGKLVVTTLDVAGSSQGDNFYRGEFVTITAHLKSDSVAKSGPLKVRIYLSTDKDGAQVQHEFDVFHDVSLGKPADASIVKHEVNSFHDVFKDKSGNLSVTGRYIIPYTIAPGDSYWIVVEISQEKVTESSENNTKTTLGITVPCDKLVSTYNANHCGDHD